MAYVYSHSFIKSHAGLEVLYTCPAGFRAVVRNVTIFNSSLASSGTGHLIHWPSSCTILQWVVAPPAALEGAESVNQLLHFVFDAGEWITCANDSSVDMTVSGYLLSLP